MQNEYSAAERERIGKRSGAAGIVCNLALSAGKIAAGLLSGSIALTADGLNNLTDAASSLITLVCFKVSARPADKEHPFGHARIEYISGLIVSILVLLVGTELFKSSLKKIIAPDNVEYGVVSFAVLIISIAVKLALWVYNGVNAKKIGSTALAAAAKDSRNDAIATFAVLVGAVVAVASGVVLDGWLGLAVSVFIVFSGIGLIRQTMSPLLGESPDRDMVEDIYNHIKSYGEVLGVHDLVVHDYGPGRRFATVHCEMDYRLDNMRIHEVADQIERDYARKGVHLTVHSDPVVTDDSEVDRYKKIAAEALASIDRSFTFHDFRIVRSPSFTNLIFDVVLPADFAGSEKKVEAELLTKIRESDPNVYLVVDFDRDFS